MNPWLIALLVILGLLVLWVLIKLVCTLLAAKVFKRSVKIMSSTMKDFMNDMDDL